MSMLVFNVYQTFFVKDGEDRVTGLPVYRPDFRLKGTAIAGTMPEVMHEAKRLAPYPVLEQK